MGDVIQFSLVFLPLTVRRYGKQAACLVLSALFCTGIAWDSPDRLAARNHATKREWDKAAQRYLALIDKAPYDINLVREARLPLLHSGHRKQLVQRLIVAGQASGLKFSAGSAEIGSGWKELELIGKIFRNAKEQEIFLTGLGELNRENYEKAIEKFSEVEKQDSGHVENLIRRGQAYFLAGNLRKSEDDFKAVLQVLPDESESLIWLGRIFQVQGKTQAAEKWYERALKILQKNPSTHLKEKGRSQRFEVWYAEFLAQTKRIDLARKRLESYTSENPVAVRGLLTLAKIYMQTIPLRHSDLWSARKILQVGLSRLEDASSEWKRKALFLESDWGLSMDYGLTGVLGSPGMDGTQAVPLGKELKEEMRVLLTELDLRLQEK